MNFHLKNLPPALKFTIFMCVIFTVLYLAADIFVKHMEKKCAEKCFAKDGASYTFTTPAGGTKGGFTHAACQCVKEKIEDK